MNAVQVRGLVKGFPAPGGEVRVLRGLSVEVRRGELLWVRGDNGSGKTTLLKVLATLLSAEGGVVRVFGLDPERQGGAVRRRVGFAGADSGSFYWQLSGRANLEFFAGLRGLGRGRARERVAACLEAVGLTAARADRPFWTNSTGYRRRLVIARALLGQPELLLLDEPLMGLDGGGQEQVRRLLERRREEGTSTVVVSQRRPEVTGPRVVCLHGGVLVDGDAS